MRPNVDGVVFGVRAVVPSMARRGGGAIVATASLAGLIAYSPDPIYALTKHAVVGLVRALGPQLAEKGITINAVCPGLVDTPLVGERRLAALRDAHFPVIAPEDIADAVFGLLTGTDTALPWVCQAGRPAVAYHHRRVPGPRAEGAEGHGAAGGHGRPRPGPPSGGDGLAADGQLIEHPSLPSHRGRGPRPCAWCFPYPGGPLPSET